MTSERRAVVVAAARTPIARVRGESGAYAALHPASLLSICLLEALDRAGVDPALVDDVMVGCVSQAGEQTYNIARSAWLAAGLPEHVPATTIDRQCGSSQQAVHFAAQAIAAGAADVVIAAGVESMSRVPMFSSTAGAEPHPPELRERYHPGLITQGVAAELVSARRGFSRTDLDEVALESHRRAERAACNGRFEPEIVPLPALAGDDGIRPDTSMAKLGALKPAFASDEAATRFPEISDWRVTAGNSSQIADGAASLILVEKQKALALGLKPLAAITHGTVVAADPIEMFTAVVPATNRLLDRAGMTIDDVDLFEVNEAFACVPLLWQMDTGADPARVNVSGGAIALGHPLGASGARLMVTLVHELIARDAHVGLQTMCEAGGMANATLVERLAG